MLNEALTLIALTLAPFLELRASIPYGIFQTSLSLPVILAIAIAANIALAPILYLFYRHLIHLFLRIRPISSLWQRLVVRSQTKIHPYVEKYGVLGLAFFIGIPLPGSGVYTAAIAAYVLGFEFRDFLIASIIGVLIAAAAVTLISLFGKGVWVWFIQ